MRPFDVVWWWFLHATGSDNPSGVEYGFWSGWGSIFIQPAIFTGLVVFYLHHSCHVHGCFRLSKHDYEMDGVVHRLCRKHHPAIQEHLTADAVNDHFQSAITVQQSGTAESERSQL